MSKHLGEREKIMASVDCAKHGEGLGCVVCKHIVYGQATGFRIVEGPGALCFSCIERISELSPSDLFSICDTCLLVVAEEYIGRKLPVRGLHNLVDLH